MTTAPTDDFGDPVEPDRTITGGRYRLPHPVTGEQVKGGWMRCTNLTKAIADTYLLDLWKLRMVAKGVAITPRLHALAASTPTDGDATPEDRQTLNDVADQAMSVAGAADGRDQGSALHQFTHALDAGRQVHVPEQWQPDIDAYQREIARRQLTYLPGMIECMGVCLDPAIAGTFDRLGHQPGWRLPRVMDLKTGSRLDLAAVEISIQLAIYSRFRHLWNRATKSYYAMPEVDQEWATIIHLPVGQKRCELIDVDLTAGWELAQTAVAVTQARKRKNLYRPCGDPPTLAPVSAPQLDPFGLPVIES